MKTERVVYRSGSFIDYAGNKRNYIVAALSQVLPEDGYVIMNDEDLINFHSNDLDYDGKDVYVDYYRTIVPKSLSLGFAICNAGDTFNESIGKEIALGRARKKPQRQLFASNLGLINTKVVDAVLEQEMEYFESNPGTIITGYDHSKEQYLKNEKNNK